jgi:hypothetical protein
VISTVITLPYNVFACSAWRYAVYADWSNYAISVRPASLRETTTRIFSYDAPPTSPSSMMHRPHRPAQWCTAHIAQFNDTPSTSPSSMIHRPHRPAQWYTAHIAQLNDTSHTSPSSMIHRPHRPAQWYIAHIAQLNLTLCKLRLCLNVNVKA